MTPTPALKACPDDRELLSGLIAAVLTHTRATESGALNCNVTEAREALCRVLADATSDTSVGRMSVPAYDKCDTYVAGQYVFNYLRTFLAAAGIDASLCKLIIELPDRDTLLALVSTLQREAKGSSRSAARVGNHSGTWQGVEYEFSVKGWNTREALSAVPQEDQLERNWQTIDTAPTDGTPLLLFARAKNATAEVRVIGWHLPGLGWIECCFTPHKPVGLVPSLWQPLAEFPGERRAALAALRSSGIDGGE